MPDLSILGIPIASRVAGCPTCSHESPIISGAGGTWLRCPRGHEKHLDSKLAKRARYRLTLAVRAREAVKAMTQEQRTDYRDRMATFRDAARLAHAEVLTEAGVTERAKGRTT